MRTSRVRIDSSWIASVVILSLKFKKTREDAWIVYWSWEERKSRARVCELAMFVSLFQQAVVAGTGFGRREHRSKVPHDETKQTAQEKNKTDLRKC